MRVHPCRRPAPEELRRGIQRLGRLPLRPHTARLLIHSPGEDPADDDPEVIRSPKALAACQLDPGWVLAQAGAGARPDPLALVAECPWWPPAASAGALAELLGRLWRHSAAVGLAARGLAREAGDPDPDAVARAGQLCCLGCWALAAVEPEWLVSWFHQEDPRRRRQQEWEDLGSDLDDLGRRLAERWGCDPLVVDAVWLHADPGGTLKAAAARPDRLAFIQRAYRWAEQTPWSLGHPHPEAPPSEPRLRILMAEVQARCVGPFVDADATPQEERLTRQNARLRRELHALREARARGERLVQLLADSPPAETPEAWADRAARAWCAEPEVNAARVVWHDGEAAGPAAGSARGRPGPAAAPGPSDERRPPTLVLPLGGRGGPRASLELWCPPEAPGPERWLAPSTVRRAWDAWAALLADRARLERRLGAVVDAVRRQAETEEARLRRRQLDALAEFAAGAGHELNNPLAVIAGRAQLLLARTADPEVARALRIIRDQAQRTHRILRDLMFIARPPALRCRPCRPSEVLEALLREFEPECAARGVRLLRELDESPTAIWADPEALRHLAEILLRNALQATPAGGTIHVRSGQQGAELIWSFRDTGKGILAGEAVHLFDPFFCGRQAGRGLGLGLPRAARIVDLAGGRLRWTSSPGRETTFHVHLPLTTPPDPAGPNPPTPRASAPDGDRLLRP